VVVVLPASMWAIIPILRYRSNGYCVPWLNTTPGPGSGDQRFVSANHTNQAINLLDTVMREGPVGLCHLVRFFTLADRSPGVIGCIHQLASQLLGEGRPDREILAACRIQRVARANRRNAGTSIGTW
jgi:hypothetical protein